MNGLRLSGSSVQPILSVTWPAPGVGEELAAKAVARPQTSPAESTATTTRTTARRAPPNGFCFMDPPLCRGAAPCPPRGGALRSLPTLSRGARAGNDRRRRLDGRRGPRPRPISAPGMKTGRLPGPRSVCAGERGGVGRPQLGDVVGGLQAAQAVGEQRVVVRPGKAGDRDLRELVRSRAAPSSSRRRWPAGWSCPSRPAACPRTPPAGSACSRRSRRVRRGWCRPCAAPCRCGRAHRVAHRDVGTGGRGDQVRAVVRQARVAERAYVEAVGVLRPKPISRGFAAPWPKPVEALDDPAQRRSARDGTAVAQAHEGERRAGSHRRLRARSEPSRFTAPVVAFTE